MLALSIVKEIEIEKKTKQKKNITTNELYIYFNSYKNNYVYIPHILEIFSGRRG